MIFIMVFVLWLIFNGRITVEICILGLIFAAAIHMFSGKYLEFGKEKKKFSFRRMAYLIEYFLILVVEIIKANVQVLKIVLQYEVEFEPCIIYFKTDLKETVSRVMLANSITLTPGTITVSLEGDQYCVHCLDKVMAEGLDDSVFVHQLRKLEEV